MRKKYSIGGIRMVNRTIRAGTAAITDTHEVTSQGVDFKGGGISHSDKQM